MESLLSLFLLFIAAITALITYMTVPRVPVAILMMASAVVLAAGLWWHWSQFAEDYRTSTWTAQLRNYASYVIVLVVILLSYGFYVFAWSGSSFEQLAAQSRESIVTTGRNLTEQISASASRALSVTSEALFGEPQPEAKPASRSANFLS